MHDLKIPDHPNLLVGLETRDDAGVYKLNDEMALIQTMDFFTPMVDDPYIFGQIAAVNSINDVYAMGGTPLTAMNLVCFPRCGDLGLLKRIIEGGLDKIREAGALLVGGHTVDDNEPKYGLSVTGLIHPQKLISNNGACPGDHIFLTKPLGTGVISTAVKGQIASPQAEAEAVKWMSTLNKDGCEAMQEVGVNAATDVTGFGLIGHLFEMAAASDVAVELYSGQIQFITGTMEYAGMGLIPAGAYNNRDYLTNKAEFNEAVDVNIRDLLVSPETAGGLLIAVSSEKAEQLSESMTKKNCVCFEIGLVTGKGFKPIKVVK